MTRPHPSRTVRRRSPWRSVWRHACGGRSSLGGGGAHPARAVGDQWLRQSPQDGAPPDRAGHSLRRSGRGTDRVGPSEFEAGPAWTGDAELRLFDSPTEELSSLSVEEIIGGYYRQVGVVWNGVGPWPRSPSMSVMPDRHTLAETEKAMSAQAICHSTFQAAAVSSLYRAANATRAFDEFGAARARTDLDGLCGALGGVDLGRR